MLFIFYTVSVLNMLCRLSRQDSGYANKRNLYALYNLNFQYFDNFLLSPVRVKSLGSLITFYWILLHVFCAQPRHKRRYIYVFCRFALGDQLQMLPLRNLPAISHMEPDLYEPGNILFELESKRYHIGGYLFTTNGSGFQAISSTPSECVGVRSVYCQTTVEFLQNAVQLSATEVVFRASLPVIDNPYSSPDPSVHSCLRLLSRRTLTTVSYYSEINCLPIVHGEQWGSALYYEHHELRIDTRSSSHLLWTCDQLTILRIYNLNAKQKTQEGLQSGQFTSRGFTSNLTSDHCNNIYCDYRMVSDKDGSYMLGVRFITQDATQLYIISQRRIYKGTYLHWEIWTLNLKKTSSFPSCLENRLLDCKMDPSPEPSTSNQNNCSR